MQTNEPPQEELFVQTTIQNGIEVIRLTNGSHQAVMQFINLIEPSFQNKAQVEHGAKTLIDMRQADRLPMAFIFKRFQWLISTYGEIGTIRIAYLHNWQFLHTVAETLTSLLRLQEHQIAFFSDYDEAIAWLNESSQITGTAL